MNRKQHIIQVPEVKRVGVYAIHNKVTDKYYVGSSSNVNSRLKTHRSNIEKLYGSNMKMDEDLKNWSWYKKLRIFNFGNVRWLWNNRNKIKRKRVFLY